MPGDVRTRLLEGTYDCVVRQGIGGTSLEDAARAAGVSRATLYRYFPGGRDELMGAVIMWETLRFFQDLAEAVSGAPDLETLIVDGIVWAHRAIGEHAVLQTILRTEPELLTPQLTVDAPRLVFLLQTFFLGRFAGHELKSGLRHDEASEYVARMVLSFISSPGGWDLEDPAGVRRLVRSEILAGVVPTTDSGRRTTVSGSSPPPAASESRRGP